ncbi:acyl--CoA ligase [Bradyrhizobium sp. Arg62]|uniref:class I adenylate-forming enzyme family protein n=1 Tax=Bradyrhizobium brasilense TaxID=1419277 RepID=UPI001E4C2689|nr:class I adenylate-forming enzyme family protein [Bradyrhizobium brasilense]MCC8950530.1 acyl--CoA ligase [Bradyrhizobium brasilense]
MTDETWPKMSVAEAHAVLTARGAAFEIRDEAIEGAPTRTWKHGPATLRDVFINGMRFRNREFLIYEEERITFDGFGRATLALAHRLIADGVTKGDRVAIIMRNLPEWPVAFWAGQLIGAIVTPLNAWWTGPELEYGLADSEAKIAIVDAERLERMTTALDLLRALEKLYVARGGAVPSDPKVYRLEDWIGSNYDWTSLPERMLPDVPLQPDDDSTILYTSGTTGVPKGALGTHRNLTSSIATAAVAVARDALREGKSLPEPNSERLPQRVSLVAVPLFHVTGLAISLTPALNNGGKVVLMRRWEPELAMQLIERERVNQTGGVPTIAWQLVEHPARAKYDLSSLNWLVYGGAPAGPELARRIKESIPSASPGFGWGMTEVSGAFTRNLGKDYVARPDSAGFAPPAGDMQVRDPSDGTVVLPAGATGELWVCGPGVVKGYWKKPEATAATFVDGWLRTGDMARIDDEQRLFVVDRLKDMLIRGGENIYCGEVENALCQHPDVIEAALVGIPHRTLGEEPGAVVRLRVGGSATEAELRDHVRSKLAAFKVPVRVVLWDEPLPRNLIGKIMKSQLKCAFAP